MAPRIHILAVGALDGHFAPAFEHYRRLLRGLVTLEVREVKAVPLRGRSEAEVLRDEGRRLLALLPASGRTVALDGAGRMLDSFGFADELRRRLEEGPVTFVIGGSLGLDETVRIGRRRAALTLGADAAASAGPRRAWPSSSSAA